MFYKEELILIINVLNFIPLRQPRFPKKCSINDIDDQNNMLSLNVSPKHELKHSTQYYLTDTYATLVGLDICILFTEYVNG